MATTKPRATQIRGLAKQQAPYLFNIIPDSYLPDSTGDVDVYGEFFTPDMTVSADGQTVNYFTFISSGHIKVNMTRGSVEGTFGLTLNNGIEAYFSDVLLIVLGTVFEPTQGDWINITEPILIENNNLKVKTLDVIGSADLGLSIDLTKDFRIQMTYKVSSLKGQLNNTFVDDLMRIINPNDGSYARVKQYIDGTKEAFYSNIIDYRDSSNQTTSSSGYFGANNTPSLTNSVMLEWDGSLLYFYVENTLKYTFISGFITDNMDLRLYVKNFDCLNIKYIELAT